MNTSLSSTALFFTHFDLTSLQRKKKLQPWQLFVFDFCADFSITQKRNVAALLSIVSKYRHYLEYFMYVRSWMKDARTIRNPLGLFLWKFNQDRKLHPTKFTSTWSRNEEARMYKSIRTLVRNYVAQKKIMHLSNKEKLAHCSAYHASLATRYKSSGRECVRPLVAHHEKIVHDLSFWYEKLVRAHLT